MVKRFMGPSTRAVHAGEVIDEIVGGVTTPIHTASSYLYRDDRPIGYPRYNTIPTQRAVADKIAALESAEAGLAFGSGMAAISTVFLAFLQAGDHAIIQKEVYGGAHLCASQELPRFGIEVDFVDGNPESFAAAVRANTKLIYFETPTNPLLTVVDIQAVAALAKERGLLTVMDNTFATPILQRPLELGVDIVLHSGTKYMGGHSDLNCGLVATRSDLMERIDEVFHSLGPTLNVYDCYLLERSMKTLDVRMERHCANARKVAEFFVGRSEAKRVFYPGLADHPGRDIAARQMSDGAKGFGGMVSVELNCSPETARRFVDSLTLFAHAVSLGGVESLVCFPALTSHQMMSREEREAAGVTDSVIRFSVGIEDGDDLLADIDEALKVIA